jgi:hypothetical protein
MFVVAIGRQKEDSLDEWSRHRTRAAAEKEASKLTRKRGWWTSVWKDTAWDTGHLPGRDPKPLAMWMPE